MAPKRKADETLNDLDREAQEGAEPAQQRAPGTQLLCFLTMICAMPGNMTSNAETLHGASMASLHKIKSRSSRHRDVMKSAGAAQVSMCTDCSFDR